MKPSGADAAFRAARCDGKKTYPLFKQAERAATWLRRTNGDIVEPYRCRSCNGFHLGSSEHRGHPLKDR